MQKRGQLNILIYAVISIVAVFALIMGYQAIKNITEKSKETMLAEFKNKLLVDIAPLKYEDVVVKTYDFPSDVKTVCFIDKDIIGKHPSAGLSRYPLLKNSIESGAKKNIFLLNDNGGIVNSFYTEFKVFGPGYYCEPVINGKAVIKLGGKEEGLKGIATNFEETGTIPPNKITEIKLAGATLTVKGGTKGNQIKFSVTKKDSILGSNVVSDEYDVKFCNADGSGCKDVPSGISLDISIDYPCIAGTTYTIRTASGSGIFNGKTLTCNNGNNKLVGAITT